MVCSSTGREIRQIRYQSRRDQIEKKLERSPRSQEWQSQSCMEERRVWNRRWFRGDIQLPLLPSIYRRRRSTDGRKLQSLVRARCQSGDQSTGTAACDSLYLCQTQEDSSKLKTTDITLARFRLKAAWILQRHLPQLPSLCTFI